MYRKYMRFPYILICLSQTAIFNYSNAISLIPFLPLLYIYFAKLFSNKFIIMTFIESDIPQNSVHLQSFT